MTHVAGEAASRRNSSQNHGENRRSPRRKAGRRTKIVATLGPACWREPALSRVLSAGVDVVRLNFSHATQADHEQSIAAVRAAESRLGWPICILQDLGGPKIRIGRIDSGVIPLQRGKQIVIDPDVDVGNAERVGISFDGIAQVVRRNTRLLLDDGRIELRVVSVEGRAVVCRVVRGEQLRERKGVNLPGVPLPLPSVTEKDLSDLAFGVAHGVDVVALSFVRSAEDVAGVQKRIRSLGGSQPVIAKLERAEAIDNLDAVLATADGIMIARGDMAVELSPEQVPIIQKRAIARATALGKPVITATQMLESMVNSPRPSRAEASDVANAILDGTDAVMLSEETAAGHYPVEAVRTMHRIAQATERAHLQTAPLPVLEEVGEVPRAIARSACRVADSLKAIRLVVFTQTGSSARYVSKCRPETPILAVTTSPAVSRRLQLLYGVRSLVVRQTEDTDAMFDVAEEGALASGHARPGDTLVFVFGQPINRPGGTNTVTVHVAASRRKQVQKLAAPG
jgi:pyruvate kinase